MIIALHRTGKVTAVVAALGISALLFSGALRIHPEDDEANTLRAPAPAQYQPDILVDCNAATFARSATLAHSATLAQLMSFCSRMLIHAVVLRASACFALLDDAVRLADWRAARLPFDCAQLSALTDTIRRQTIRLAFIPNRLR